MLSNKKIQRIVLICLSIFVVRATEVLGQAITPCIIPKPNNIKLDNGEKSKLSSLVFHLPKIFANDYLTTLITSMPHASLTNDPSKANVEIDHQCAAKASYQIEIQPKKLVIHCSDATGLQYAVTSLHQWLTHQGFPLPLGYVADESAFSYRGMHLDVSRHFFTVQEVKKYLDFLAYYKFNNFHWHLTDDQGWRIEIKKFPKLTSIGGYRSETLVGHYNDKQTYDGKRYGGFYTQAEIKEVVAYATQRHINVIPEIEMPGHAQAAIAAYPELGCTDHKVEVATKWGVFEDVFCPTETTFHFLEQVLDEVCTLFPSTYIHIGGDECPKTAWEYSDFCQQLMKEKGIKDEHALQSYFITRMEKYLNKKGKQIIGWDEILEGGLAPNATVMSWRGIEGGLDAARQNHDVVMTPGSHCYFDYYQSESPSEPLAIGGYIPLEKVYAWNPIPEELENNKRHHILGGQGNVWSEYLGTFANVEYMAYARAMAMAEVLWTKERSYADFVTRYAVQNDWWKSNGVNMANHLLELKPSVSAGNGKGVSVSFDVTNDISIWINDKPMVEKNFALLESGNYSFVAKQGEKQGKPVTITFDKHLATNTTISFEAGKGPNERYKGNGNGSIVNGVLGSDHKFGGTEWLGFSTEKAVATLDFQKSQRMSTFQFRFFNAPGQWIYAPKKVVLMASNDGISFTEVATKTIAASEEKIIPVKIEVEKTLEARFIKFEVTNFGIIPAGAQGSGNMAWLFMDELIVR